MTRLGMIVGVYCAVHKLSVRQCSTEIGITPSTLRRLQGADGDITVTTFMKILSWLLATVPEPRKHHH